MSDEQKMTAEDEAQLTLGWQSTPPEDRAAFMAWLNEQIADLETGRRTPPECFEGTVEECVASMKAKRDFYESLAS